jgi:hypothetical protein
MKGGRAVRINKLIPPQKKPHCVAPFADMDGSRTSFDFAAHSLPRLIED